VTTLSALPPDEAVPVLDDDPRLADARTPTVHAHNEYAASGHAHANDHARQHSVTSASDHTFPGGTTNFLRADGQFAAPPGGGGSRFPQSLALGGYVVLTNVGAAYDTIAAAKGLGFAEVDFTGCTRLDFTVRCNKVGTGTQSWQLWDESAGAQLAVIDDAAAAGDNKVLTVAVTSNLPTGVKHIRVRAKSTVAADDPVWYGGALRLS
jgi:hypothetical protein